MPDGYNAVLAPAQADGAALTGTAIGSILPTSALYLLPGGTANIIGKQFRVHAFGRISNIVTTPGTLTLTLKFGSSLVAVSQAMQLNTTAQTNVWWRLHWYLTVRSVGSGTAATLMHQGSMSSTSMGTGAVTPVEIGIPVSAPAVGAGFDSTAANLVDLQGQFSLTGNSLTLHQYALESVN